MDPSNIGYISFLSFRVIFHFHDYERKSIVCLKLKRFACRLLEDVCISFKVLVLIGLFL